MYPSTDNLGGPANLSSSSCGDCFNDAFNIMFWGQTTNTSRAYTVEDERRKYLNYLIPDLFDSDDLT